MATFSEWINRLRYLGRRPRFERDLDEEVRFHIESRAMELRASGFSASDAMALARKEFGSIARANENSRAAWQFRWVEDLGADLRCAGRSFRRSPGFAVTAILSLALGIGANVAIFNALYSVLWRPLPVAGPDRLAALSISSPGRRGNGDLPLAFIEQLQHANIFAGISVDDDDGLSFTYDGRAERVVGEVVSPNYFDLLGVPPILGQPFTAGLRDGHWTPEVVLSYNFWKRRFAADRNIIGQTIQINTYPFTIAGVSPSGFFGLERGNDFDLRIPILPEGQEIAQIEQISARPDRRMNAVARLKPGMTPVEAEASADAQLQEFLHTTPIERWRTAEIRHLRMTPAATSNTGPLQPFQLPLYILFVLVALVLLIACANVANMLLARATAQARELAVRAAIGAGRWRLVRQMLAESLLLALLAGSLATAVGNWTANLLIRYLPQGHMKLTLDLHPDAATLLFTIAVCLLSGTIFGLGPALSATRGDLAIAMKADAAASTGNPRARFRKALVASQVAFSLVLLIAAGVFLRTMSDLRPADYRTNPDRVLLFTMKPQREIYSPARKLILASELIRRVSALPGVQSAALAENGPLGSRSSSDTVQTPDHETCIAETDWITPGFFDTIGMRRIAGRDFTAADRDSASPKAIINQSLARSLFPDTNPVGRTIVLLPGRKDPRRFEIIGIVADTRYYDLHTAPQPAAWFTFQDYAAPYMPTLHVLTNRSDTSAVTAAIRHEFDALDKGFPVFNVKTLELRIEDSLAQERMVANLSGGIGLLALALAAVGLYGVLSYSVTRRTREIGIRMALGSNALSVLRMIVREVFVLIMAGSLAGVMLSIAAYRLLSHYWLGVSPIDPLVLTVCAAIMLSVAATAVSIPAIRACRVDPLTALRHE